MERWLEPAICTIGKRSVVAVASATRPLRNPAPDVVGQLPGRFVRKPAAAAAWPASLSWRKPI